MRQIAVFDTNVLFSGMGGWVGKPYECVELARRGRIESVTCAELLQELIEKFQHKLSFTTERTVSVVADFISFSRVVSIPGQIHAVTDDPDDNAVLECAVIGQATHIVTGDKKHLLPMKQFRGIRIVTPAEFLDMVIPANPA